MTLNEHQIQFIQDKLSKYGLDYIPLFDNILDHICCLIENEMAIGQSFDVAEKISFSKFSESEIINIQSLTLRKLNMERNFSLKLSGLFSIQFISLSLMCLMMSKMFLMPVFLTNMVVFGNIIGMFFILSYGWINEFPRWTIPSIGFCILFSLYLTNVSIPSITGKSIVGIWGIVPLLITIALSYLIKPSSKALNKLIDKIKDEKTLILFIFYGFLPFFLLLIYDEVTNPITLNLMLIPFIIMTAGAFFFFYLKSKRLRALAIFLGGAFSTLISFYIV